MADGMVGRLRLASENSEGATRAVFPRNANISRRVGPREQRFALASPWLIRHKAGASKHSRKGTLMGTVDAKLQELGITLPTPASPVANYVPFVRTGNLVVISGQICFGADGKIADAHKGKLGAEVSLE